jgi:cellulose synthase/poly-beta-1,6-N-acetylglucosamine synthase-like glycosyltransferase
MHNFWDVHGVWFIVFMFFFPRLTLLFSSVLTGGFFWWLGFIFTPRLLVAILATKVYLHTNPVLVVLSWIWAIAGEKFEKKNIVFKKYGRQNYQEQKNSEIEQKHREDVIDI